MSFWEQFWQKSTLQQFDCGLLQLYHINHFSFSFLLKKFANILQKTVENTLKARRSGKENNRNTVHLRVYSSLKSYALTCKNLPKFLPPQRLLFTSIKLWIKRMKEVGKELSEDKFLFVLSNIIHYSKHFYYANLFEKWRKIFQQIRLIKLILKICNSIQVHGWNSSNAHYRNNVDSSKILL